MTVALRVNQVNTFVVFRNLIQEFDEELKNEVKERSKHLDREYEYEMDAHLITAFHSLREVRNKCTTRNRK